MARFKIYSKDGQTVRHEGCPRFNGTYLKVSYLEFSSIASPTPIAWQVGDYVDYPRTGLRYTLRSIPAVKKTAKPGQTGDAFVYQNVQFMAQTQDLAVAPFIDLVPEDNGVHFSTQSAVSTFENAYGIAARIQACLDDFFPGVWEVKVYENLDEDFAKKISEAADFSIDGGTCLEACDRMYDIWGIGWTHYKDASSGKDVLLFGRPNTKDSGNTSAEFVFGPGQGLTAIKRSVANSDEMGTRLRVFGSSRNMLPGYYNGLDIHNAESVDIQNLMIPPSKWGTTDGKPDARKAYLQASDEVVEQLGLIPRTHYFDGSDGEEIYPSLEGATIGDVRDAKEESGDTDYVPTIEIYPSDSERVDEIKAVVNPEDDGYSGGSDGSKYKDTQTVSFPGLNREPVQTVLGGLQYYWIFQHKALKQTGTGVTVDPGMEGYVEDPNDIIADSGTAVNGEIQTVTYGVRVSLLLISGNEDTQYTNRKTVSVEVEKQESPKRYTFTLPEITLENPADPEDISLKLEIVVTVKDPSSVADVRTYYVNLSGWDFLLGEFTPVTDGFTLALKQIGFDISQRASFTSDGLARVYMKDGMNAGRSFYVKTCSFDSLGDQWLLGMYRTEDESTGMRYPNSQYPVKPGDHFVLLDIAMPELYIGIAQQRLYDKGLEMLNDISRVKPYYEPEVDAIVMAKQSRTLREGMYMRLSDADVSGASSEYVLIDTLTINEGEAEIPTYKVTLREYKRKTFQETTSAAIDSISQKVSEGAAGKPTVSGATYGSLKDKPSIDGVTLAGAMRSYDDIGLLNKTHFEVVNVGTEESPILALRTKYGIVSESFISARGSDPEAGGGASGVDMDTVWAALAAGTSELINVSHIPELSISKITGLQDALDSKLESITKPMVEAVLTGTITSHNHDGRYAPLSGGLIPSQYLPSYVDDVLEYASLEDFPATGETEKIYVALDTNLTYRWGGSSYVEISPSLALGHTSSTAYPGDEGAANASAIRALQGYFTNGAANRVAHELTISYSGGDSETYDGSSAVTVTMPTAAQMSLWDRICALFDIDDDGHVYVTGNRGFYGNSFISARGSDPEAGSGGGGGGLDVQAMWYALAQPTNEKINASHIPAIGMDKVSGLADALAGKLSGITGQMVKDALGYTPYDAAAISAASVAYAASSGTAGKVAHALTVKHDGGSSSASAKTYNGSAAVTVTIPTTLPASDVYAWAKAATKPSYTWGEIGGKPTEFTPAEHTHVKADITDFPTSWAWSAITGKPSTLAGYGIKDGVNSVTASGGLSASVSGHKLTVGVASGYAVPTSAQIGAWNLVASLFGIDGDGNVYVKDSRGFYGNSFISARGSDPEAGQGGGGSGVDMESVWYALGQPTTEKINVSHIPALQQLSGSLTNAQLVNDSISVAGVAVALGGSVSTAQIASALTAAGYKLTDTVATLASLGITATAAEINKLDGLATTAAELGYVHGVTSNIQTQLNGKANASALTAYALKDGSNASGLWPISVSGIANRAVYLTSTYTGSGGLQPPSYFNGMGLKVNMMNKPVSYCDVIFVNGYNGQGSNVPYVNALAFQKTANAHGEVYHARGDYGGSSWGTWYKFLDEYNYAGTLDTRYLLKSAYTASDILAKLKTVDGSGSGLDADLLDGYNIGSVRLGVSDLGAQIAAAGWYRVYTSVTNNAQQYNNIILHIGRRYVSPQNEHYTFSISVGFNGDINITQLSGVTGGHLITKIRVVWANSQPYFIDIYTDCRNYENSYSVYGQGYGTFSGFTAGATIPSGYSSYEFTTVEGCKSDRGFIGSLSGNASSATKVAHALSIVAGDVTTVYDGSAAKSVTVPTAEQIGAWNLVASLFGIDGDGNVYVKDNRGFYGNSFISARGSDPEAGSGGGSGVDMESVWYALGQPTNEKINVSHIPALQQLSGTLTNAQLVNDSVTVAGVAVALGGSVSTTQIASALTTAGYKLTDTIYTLPKATVSALGGIKAAGVRTSAITTTQGGTTSGRYYGVELDSNGKAFVNVPWVNTTYSLSSFGITATAAELNKLDGLATTATELGYVHGVTSSIQSQLNAKANASALSAYALKNGSNASGLWPISVSGNAASADTATIADRAVYLTSTYTGSGGLQPPSYFNGMGLKVNMMNKPVSYCDVIFVNGYNGQGSNVPYVNALAFQKTANAHGEVYHARGDYGGSSWGTWYKFLDEYNYAGTLDTRYLLKSAYTASDILAKLKTVDGSGSGLDADLLDGYNIGSVRLGVSDLGAQIAAAGWYRVYTSVTNNAQQYNNIILHIGRRYVSPQNEHYTFSISVGFNGDINITQLSGVTGGHLITKIRVVWANSQPYFIDIYTDCRNYENSYSVYGQGYGTFSGFTAGATIPSGYSSYEFTTVEGCKSDRGFIGSLSGNASSATKLATARSIWGRTFDGTQGVDGHLYLGSPDYRLYFGTSGLTPFLTATGGLFQIVSANDTTWRAPLVAVNISTGNMGIGMTPTGNRLDVNGTIHSTTGIWSNGYVSAKGQDTTSDARYKRDVASLPAQAALAVLMRLRPSTWAWKDDGCRGAGFIAQEVMGVLPEAVREVGNGEDRHLALNYQMLHAYEVSALQTHETELERLRGRVNQLENEIKQIQHGS